MKSRSLAVLLLTATLGAGLTAMPFGSGHALTVFDPSNYAKNAAQAARALEQINNQIQSLQNQALVLQNLARNLQRLDYTSIGQIRGALTRIDGLMIEAEGLSFELSQLEAEWRTQYPETYDATVSVNEIASAARERWQNAMHAFRQTMRVQSQIVANVRTDGELLSELVSRSQGAVGALQAQQAANQLIALSTKQQLQIQSLLATHTRAQAQDLARKAQGEEAARETTRRFLGNGRAYSGN